MDKDAQVESFLNIWCLWKQADFNTESKPYNNWFILVKESEKETIDLYIQYNVFYN